MSSTKLETSTLKRPLAEANKLIKIWRDHGPKTPINPKLLISGLINTQEHPDSLTVEEYELPASVDGAMLPVKNNHWAAVVNKSVTSAGRRRFTLAHELFHFLAHRKLREDFQCGRSDINSFGGESLEDDANDFAAQLLIPSDILRELDKRLFCYEVVKNAATELEVSVTALAYKWVIESKKRIGFFQSRDGFIDKGRASTPAYYQGVYFKGGSELNQNSLTSSVHSGDISQSSAVPAGVWQPNYGCNECVHKTQYEGYTYTFLDFSH